MALSMTALSPAVKGNLIPGIGFDSIVQVVWDNSYLIAGEVLDLSSVFPTEVFGGSVVADTLNDGGWKCSYVLAASGAPATGVLQAYGVQTVAATTCGPLLNALTATDLSAMNGQRWRFCGR